VPESGGQVGFADADGYHRFLTRPHPRHQRSEL
jgi:hypothetical protein